MMMDSVVEGEDLAEVGVAEGVVGDLSDSGRSGEVVIGALVLRIRSTLILAMIRIISISPGRERERGRGIERGREGRG